MTQNTTDQHHYKLKSMKGEEEQRLSLEDYKSIDSPSESDTSKVKPSPIENGQSSAPSLDSTAFIKT